MDPEEIENRQFIVTLRGYARDEVDAFREEVAQEIKILRKQLTKANSDLLHANSEVERTRAQLAEIDKQLTDERSRQAAEPDTAEESAEALPEDRAAVFRLVGKETERILLAAEQAAEQIHDRAVKESAEIMTDARMQVQRSMEELEAARRAAEEDFGAITESRSMVASQLEDIGRRLEETISRLRVPVEMPGGRSMRTRAQQASAERAAPQPPEDRVKEAPDQPQQRKQREAEAARELAARQSAHLAEASRREDEARRAQAEAERRAREEAERAGREARAREARESARREQEAKAAAAAADAERLKAAREAERLREAEEAERAARLAAERAARAEAERLAKEEAERAARAEAERLAREEAERAARAEAERLARQETERLAKVQADGAAQAEAERAAGERKQAEQKARERRAAQTAGRLLAEQAGKPDPISPEVAGAPAAEADAPDSGSSLDELLEEIRRKREEERKPAGDEHEPEIADAAGEISHRNQVMGDLPAQTARRLKRLLQEDHNDLLDRVRTQRGKGSLEDNLAPVSEQLNRFVSGLGEPLTRAFVEGRRAAGAVSPVDASQAVTRLVTRQVLNPLRAEVSKAVEAGLGAQDSPSALSERVNDVFRVWKGVRTQLLGEGIAYAAYNQGVIDALGTSPAAQKLWVAADDEHECPNDICRRNASAGGVDLKSPFPSGHLAPPAHGGCTCTLKGS